MNARMSKTVSGIFCVAAVATMPMVASAALNINDSSIINLYQLNSTDQAGANPYNNALSNQFVDTAVTGTAQNQEDASSAPSPSWVSTPAIGDGVGLDFERNSTQYTRFQPWMNTTQGVYSNGKSFTVMVRLNAESLVDNQVYDVIGIGSHKISLQGNSSPNTGGVNIQVRDQNTFWTLSGSGATNGGGSSGSNITLNTGEWVNLFMIYNANTSLTVAYDNGTTFAAQTATGAPAGFDTLTELFDNAGSHWWIGSTGSATNNFDGQIEAVAIWDKALTTTEADAVGLTTIPEPAGLGVLGLAALAGLRRRK